MDFSLQRVVRTPHSERFLLHSQGKDLAALDLHYHPNGKVDGTLIVFEGSGLDEQQMPGVLKQIDELILPEVSLQEHNLSFTVVMGRVLGAFLPGKAQA